MMLACFFSHYVMFNSKHLQILTFLEVFLSSRTAVRTRRRRRKTCNSTDLSENVFFILLNYNIKSQFISFDVQ